MGISTLGYVKASATEHLNPVLFPLLCIYAYVQQTFDDNLVFCVDLPIDEEYISLEM